MAAVHQFIPTLAAGDAIGRHTLAAQRILRAHGYRSEIFAGSTHREVAQHASPYQRFAGGPPGSTWMLYQCSTGSAVGRFCAERPEPLIVDYHNITPAELFGPWEPAVAVELSVGRLELADLAHRAQFALADSAYNAAELAALGYPDPVVVPILLDLTDFDGPADAPLAARLADDRARRDGLDWLFVGRLAPNKCQHDVITAFAAHRRIHGPGGRLHLVGGSSSHRYETALRDIAVALGVGAEVNFAAKVGHAELLAYYRSADVFVCLSEHEGFCVPLLEAMHHGVPIVAFDSSAVTETLAGGGVLLPSKEPIVVAETVHRVATDAVLRERVVGAGHRRVLDFALDRTTARFVAAIEAITGGPSGGPR